MHVRVFPIEGDCRGVGAEAHHRPEGFSPDGHMPGRNIRRVAFTGEESRRSHSISLAAYQTVGTKPESGMVESAVMSGRPKVRAVATMRRSERSARILKRWAVITASRSRGKAV